MLSSAEARNLVVEKYKNIEDSRLSHIFGVEKMAKYLANIHHVDENKAEIAALFHDFYKYEDSTFLADIICEKDRQECSHYPVLYHSYASAEAYKNFGGDDEDIYNAIRNHVFGRLGMSKLEEIILISDYTEETRKYSDCIYCRQILLAGHFYEAIYESTKRTIALLKRSGIEPHPLQIEVLKYYEGRIEN